MCWRWPARSDHARLDRISAGLNPDDAVNIQFTSGTTGAPKGATLTHRNIVNNANFVTAGDEFHRRRPALHSGAALPLLRHGDGHAGLRLQGRHHGRCRAKASSRAQRCARSTGEKCTALYGVPTMFVAMLDHPDFKSFDLSSLRTGIMAGAPCPIEVMKKVVR